MTRYSAIAVVFAFVTATVSAQTPTKMYRLAVLATDDFQPGFPVPPATLEELARQGFVEGRTLKIEPHFGPLERLPDLARELIQTHPDVILAGGDCRRGRPTRLPTPSQSLGSVFPLRTELSLVSPGQAAT